MASVTDLVPVVGIAAACESIGLPRASFYRQAGRSANPVRPSPRHEGAVGERSELSVAGTSAVVGRAHPRALSGAEQAAVLDVLHSIKGAAVGIGASQLAARCTAMEELADGGRYTHVYAASPALRQCFDATVRQLAAHSAQKYQVSL